MVGWADNDIQGVLTQAMNVGISFMLEDMVEQEKNVERLQRARLRAMKRTPDPKLTLTK